MLLVAAATVCGCFTQYQPIALCVFSFHAFFLLAIEASVTWKHQWVAALTVSIGLTISMSQLFRFDEEWDWFSVGVILGLQVGASHLFWLISIAHLFVARRSNSIISLFCYPTLVASAYSILANYSPIGSEASLGYGLAEWPAFIQVVSLFGLTGLNFSIVVISIGVAHYWINLQDRFFGLKISLIFFVTISLYGSFRMLSPYMYQKGVESTSIPPEGWVDTVCIVWPEDDNPINLTENALTDRKD